MNYFTLNNGIEMPATGFGVFRIPEGQKTEDAVEKAIDAGYRMLDTAQGYWNETSVGNGIRRSGIDRKELFLTTKVWMSEYGEKETYQSVLDSMEKMQTDYLDLVLLHQAMNDYYGAYRALEKLYEEGKLRAVGVSNFGMAQVTDLSLFAKVVPAVNQIQINVCQQETAAQEVHGKYGVRLEAWAPLGNGNPEILKNPVLLNISRKYGKSAAQVTLRWLYQRGIVTVAKSTHLERMKENLDIFDFELEPADMLAISSLNQKKTDEEDLQRAQTIEMLKNLIERENYHFAKTGGKDFCMRM